MANQITKFIAEKVAKEMAEKALGSKIKDLDNSLRSDVSNLIQGAHVPADLLALFDKHPKYFRTCSQVYLFDNTNEADGSYFPCAGNFPSVDTWNPSYGVHVDTLNYYRGKGKELVLLTKARKEAERAVIDTLLSLKTYKRIKESFPEAYALIPEDVQNSEVTALAVPIDKIREMLNPQK